MQSESFDIFQKITTLKFEYEFLLRLRMYF